MSHVPKWLLILLAALWLPIIIALLLFDSLDDRTRDILSSMDRIERQIKEID